MNNRLFWTSISVLISVIILTLILVMILVPPTDISKIHSDNGGYLGTQLKVVEIESCQYFYSPSNTDGCPMLCHKGNCKNSIHYQNVLREQVR